MSLDTDAGGAYVDPDDAWLRDQTARILHRHVLFGRHCRLDVDVLLQAARRRLVEQVGGGSVVSARREK
jgi:hypothetical protein